MKSLFSDHQVTPRAQEISSIPHQLPVKTRCGKNMYSYSKCILTEILSLAKNDIDRDISLDENDIDRDISVAENDIDREGQQQNKNI